MARSSSSFATRLQNRATKPKDAIHRGGTAKGVSPLARLQAINRWREQWNPLVNLVMIRARLLLEQAQRGEFADYQWTCKFAEERFPVLFSLISRRTSAILEMDWNIKTCSTEKSGFDQTLADDQKAALREAYERIDNLSEVFEHLVLATFRGYSHIQKQAGPDGEINHFECLDQWNFCRSGLYGPWVWNPEALLTTAFALGEKNLIDPEEFIIREVARPVNPIALVAYIYWGLGRKDWAGFVEIFGIPGGVVIGPPNVAVDKEAQYQTAGEDIAKGGSGFLPHGSDFKFNDSPRGGQPFKEFMEEIKQDVVLAGTGGLLTMLTESGSGTLAGNAHADTFTQIAKGESKKISECLQRGFDVEILEANFPGKPRLAYFELAANEEMETRQVVADIATLSTAGYKVTREEVEEKTGYELEEMPDPGSRIPNPSSPGNLQNRSAALAATDHVIESATKKLGIAQAQTLAPVFDRLRGILELEDPAAGRAALTQFKRDLPQMLHSINQDPATAKVLEDSLVAGLLNGFASATAQRTK